MRTPPSAMAAMYSGYGGEASVGRNVRFTPNGWSVISRQRRISLASSSGVFWVRPVISPRPPALETAAASSAKPTKCMPPWMMGWRMPKSSVMRVFIAFFLSPGFHVRAQVHLEGPRITRLRVQVPVVLCDVFRVQDAVLLLQRVALGELRANEFRVDGAIDHDVRNVDALGAELARHALRESAQRVLGAGECREVGGAADARRRTGEEDRAAAAHHHLAGDLTRVQEAAERGHLPDLHVLARRLFQNAAGHVGADVEHHHLDGAALLFDLVDERDHVLLLARIAAIAECLAAGGTDALHGRLELVGRATRETCDVALAGETCADGAAGGVTGANDQRHASRACRFVHASLLLNNGRTVI